MNATTRRTGTGILSALIALMLLAAACGEGQTSGAARGDTTTDQPNAEEESNGTGSSGQTDEPVVLEVWFADGAFLQPVYREHESTPRVGTAALEELLGGPGEAGLSSAIPAEARLLGLTVDDGVATVDFSSDYESGGGSLSMQMRLAQVVFTLTQFPTVQGVTFAIDGEPVDVFSGEGIVLDHALKRADFEQFTPPIVVESPRPGDTVSSPVRVEGTANVFEATVSIRILDEAGNEIERTFTTATCGTGCRGTFTADVEFSVDSEQLGTIEVFEESAEDGSPLHVVKVPVTLTP